LPYSGYWYRSDRTHPLLVKPEKRTDLFEDENGEKDNPFHDDSESAELGTDYTYPAEAFD
jgi:hypothetical protein